MSKFGCTCGHTIADQSDCLPYKGHLVRDFDEDALFETLLEEFDGLLKAVVAGDRERWLERHFSPVYPRNLDTANAFHDFVSSLFATHQSAIYECSCCGRLWVQRAGEKHFIPFSPDSGNYEQALKSPNDQRA